MSDAGYTTNQTYADGATDYGVMAFLIKSIVGRNATVSLVKVVAVTNVGAVAPVGLIDVQPMVNFVDGKGQPTKQGIINNVPYFRIQGGTNAVIIDPAAGDIGIAVFASRDISSVKNNKAISNPGSRRQFSMSDALYIGGVLNGTPENYIQFDSDGNITLKPAVKVMVTGDLEVSGDIKTAAIASINSHKHSGVQTGSGDTGDPTG